ncbi:hypothetical protein BGZ54_000015 [Gamsiella multidivaricata]|nr:hypothetical protein BGZ54_000015 [Gamsiella multidivaricata]
MGHQMYELDQGHHTLEIGIGSSTPHSVRGTDVTGVQAFDHDLRGAMNENDVADGCEGNNIVLCAEPQDEKESAPLPSGTAHSTFKSSLASTLEEFAIDPKPVIEAGKIKRFVKRSHALQELETTEESYVNDLDILLNVYLHILETRSWFPRSIHSKMQRCVSGLLALHRDFHSRLRACKVGDSEQERQELLTGYKNLAESFELLHHDNHIYSLFCELRMRSIKEINQSASQATIAWLRKDSKELMAQQGRPSIRADLKDFLIKPIQRICRYPLLLKEIMRLTSEDDSEYPYLDHAYQLMKNMAREMDEAQKAVERKLLTELFLKKLPETNFPRKTGIHSNKDHSTFGGSGENSSNTMNCSNTCGHSCNCNSRNSNGSIHVGIHSHHPHGAFRRLRTSTVAPLHSPGFAANSFLDFGFIQDGVAPIALTKAFAGTLGSIVLAGALEYVISPDVPIRLKYYGCFLFDTMLVVVKAKKSSLYEPRQWLPLRLCELHETSCLDGYTRFGWRIVFDQFRLDFGASTEAEQQTWISTLQDRIQASKDAHAKLPRDIVAFETIVSSLPWKMNKNQTPGLVSSRHLQICQQSPSPSPSPWSACSSAIPSPLMPPPPSASSSTMMMAMSSAVVVEPEKWNAGELRQTIDDCTCHEDGRLRLHHHEAPDCHTEPQCLNNPSTGDREGPCIGGMAGTEPQEKDHSEHLHSQTLRPYDRQLRPESAANLLYQSMQIPWLLTENRQRTHSFDVTRVFTSSNNSIKHNQRVLIQSMFKDVSTEDVWTTTTASQPSPQPVSALSRYGSSSPFSYFHSVTMPPSPRQGVSGILHPTVHSESIGSTTLAGEDSTGTFPVSLTNRLLRRPDSLTKVRVSTIRSEGIQEKTGKDRRRNSTTAAIAGTLSFNFRKNSDPQLSANQRLRSSTKETLRAGSAEELECTERSHHDRQTSVSAMVNRIENRTSAFLSHEIKHSQSNTELWSVDMPYLVEDDYGDKDILDTLTTAGEAARSRRGGERMTRRYSEIATVYDLKSSSSSYSLPATFFRSANTSTQSLTPSRPKDGPKDGAEKIWSAMGRMMQKRSHERSGISRSRSSSSSSSGQSQAGLASHPGNVPLVLSPMSSPMRRPLQLNHQDSVIQEDSMGHKETMCRPATVFERTLLRRSSTAGSRSTTTSSSTFSNHIRTNSASTIQSLGSESSFTGSSATEMSSSSGAPRVIMAAPSVSITGCSSEPSPEDDRTLVSVSSGTEPGSGHVVNQHLKEHQKEMQASPKIVTHALAHPRSHLERNGSSSSSHDRRKSFSILHNITYSASQKFKTLMRSPSSARRRTVMSLSPITKEQTFDSNDEGHDESQEGEEQEGDCGAKAAAT